MLILASVATFTGIEAIENTKRTKFIAELKIMQSYVNQWYEDCKPSVNATEYDKQFATNVQTKFTINGNVAINATSDKEENKEKVQKAQETLTAAGITSNQDHFYLLESSQKSALGIEGVEQDVLVNVQDRKVVSYLGLKYKNKMYYTIDSLDGENGIDAIYNVGYENPNKNPPSILVTGRSVYNGETAKGAKYKFTVDVTQGSRYINKGDLYYGKIENGEVKNWNKTEDKSFIVDREGTYKIYYKDAAGNMSEQIEYQIKPKTTLISGPNFNIKMKKLSGTSSPQASTANTNITGFKIANVKPSNSILIDNNKVSTNDSQYPTYMWYDNGTIWIWSEENWIGFNSDSSNMFNNVQKAANIELSYIIDTRDVTSMYATFYNCSGLTNLDVTGFNTEKVTTMQSMFYGCSGLTSIDVTGFNTENVTAINHMFCNCNKLMSIDVTGFNTENVTTMNHMFYGCSGLTSIDVTGFNTEKVTTMQSMFYGCSGLTGLDLSSFDTSKVTTMWYMFYNCNKLQTIYVSDNFVTTALTNDPIANHPEGNTNSSHLFVNCTKLVGGTGTTCNSSNTDKTYARIDDPTNGKPGYFTRKQNV